MFIKLFAISDGLGSGECILNTDHISHMLDSYVTMKDGRRYFLQDDDILKLRNVLTEQSFGEYSKRYD